MEATLRHTVLELLLQCGDVRGPLVSVHIRPLDLPLLQDAATVRGVLIVAKLLVPRVVLVGEERVDLCKLRLRDEEAQLSHHEFGSCGIREDLSSTCDL